MQGLATAAGCQLVATCDLAVAAEDAGFATPGVKIGLFCTTPMIPLVASFLREPAMEMLLTASPISARRALELGWSTGSFPRRAGRERPVASIAIMDPEPARAGNRQAGFYELQGLDEATAYDQAAEIMVENALCPDAREGISAFLQKRRPQWRNAGPSMS